MAISRSQIREFVKNNDKLSETDRQRLYSILDSTDLDDLGQVAKILLDSPCSYTLFFLHYLNAI